MVKPARCFKYEHKDAAKERSMGPLKIGIVGAGGMASYHVEGFTE
jgi:hypothetical protein